MHRYCIRSTDGLYTSPFSIPQNLTLYTILHACVVAGLYSSVVCALSSLIRPSVPSVLFSAFLVYVVILAFRRAGRVVLKFYVFVSEVRPRVQKQIVLKYTHARTMTQR